MKQRDFFNGTTAALIGGIFNPLMAKPQPPKDKVCVVGVGTSACAVARAVYDQLPYRVNFHSIDIVDNQHNAAKDAVTCCYSTQVIPRPFNLTDSLEVPLAADWEHNMGRYYFRSHLAYIRGDIVIVANMGRKTGTYTTLKLVQQLVKHPANRVSVIATTPFGFDWHPFGSNLAAKSLAQIKDLGVPVTVFDFPKTFEKRAAQMDVIYAEMDGILKDYLVEKLR